MWNAGQHVVEELDSDGTDTDGVGPVGNKRFSSDPLRMTGIDLGEGSSTARRRGQLALEHGGNGDGDSTSESESDEDTDGEPPVSEMEEALVESALARIRRAQAKGRSDVRLNKEELAALERRRERLERQEQRRRRREKEPRFAIPISHLAPMSRRERPAVTGPPGEDSPPRPIPGTFDQSDSSERPVQPPMGYFPPPSASRSRPLSSALPPSQRPPSVASDRRRSDSPFTYAYVNSNAPPTTTRHHSDTTAPHLRPARPENLGASASTPSMHAGGYQQGGVDPFQYMMPGSRTPHRRVSGSPAPEAGGYRGSPRGAPAPAAARGGDSRSGSRRVSAEAGEGGEENEDEDEDATTSDEADAGARIRSNSGRSRHHHVPAEEVVVVEADPSPEPEQQPAAHAHRTRKGPAGSSPVKRRSVGGSGGGGGGGSGSSSRRRKGR